MIDLALIMGTSVSAETTANEPVELIFGVNSSDKATGILQDVHSDCPATAGEYGSEIEETGGNRHKDLPNLCG
ncbi:MAG: hypothetical protein GY809_10570 [Planctomycetes bacterium]|nr:hypothetical protein [Planctomycetota bacterium]